MADEVTELKIKILSDEVSLAKRRLDDLTGTGKKAETGMDSLTRSTGKSILAFAAAAVTLGSLASGIGSATRNWIKFDTSMKEVSSIMSTSKQEFATLTEDVLKLSVSMGVDATVAAKGLYQAVSAGIPKENALAFLETASRTAIAGVTDVATAVDVLTNVINAYKIPVGEADAVSDKLFATVVVGKTTMEELSQSMSKGTVPAAALGVKLEELLASVAALTLQGTPTSEAFTQINATITALLNPSDEMNTALKNIGFSSGRAAIEALGFGQTLEALRNSIGDNDAEMVKAFRSTEAYKGVLSQTGTNLDLFKKSLEEVTKSQGDAAKAYEINAQAFGVSTQKLSSAVTLFANTIESKTGIVRNWGFLLEEIATLMVGADPNKFVKGLGDRTSIQQTLALQKKLDELKAQEVSLTNSIKSGGTAGAMVDAAVNATPIGRAVSGGTDASDLLTTKAEITKIQEALEKQGVSVANTAAAWETLKAAQATGNQSAIAAAENQLGAITKTANAANAQATLEAANAKEAQTFLSELDAYDAYLFDQELKRQNAKSKLLEEAANEAKQFGVDELQLIEEKIAKQFELLAVTKDPAVIDNANAYLEILRKQKDELLEQREANQGTGMLPPLGELAGAGVPGLGGLNDVVKSDTEEIIQSHNARQEGILKATQETETKRNAIIAEGQKTTLNQLDRAAKDAAAKEEALQKLRYTSTKQAFDDLSTAASAFGEKGFKLAQAAAIASATVTMISSAQTAYKNGLEAGGAYAGWILGPTFAGVAMAAGAANIAAIKSQSYSAYAQGGMIPAGQTGLVGEAGPEFVRGPAIVTSAAATANQRRGKDGSDSKPMQVIINNLPGQSVDMQERDGPDMKTVEFTIAKLTAEAQNGGGKFVPALSRSHGLKRKTN